MNNELPRMSHPRRPDAVLSLKSGFGTDRGRCRDANEDSLLAAATLFAVADGMGGHEAGEKASAICVRTLARLGHLSAGRGNGSAAEVQDAIDLADSRIRAATGSLAGTTLSGVLVTDKAGSPYWLVFNVGDSRTYRLSGEQFRQVTVDHSEVQELVDAREITTEQAFAHPRRNVITRAVGIGDEALADFWLLPIQEGDRVLICSDGLNGEISDDQIGAILRDVADPQNAVDELIAAALVHGGRDNISAIVVDAAWEVRPRGR